MGKSEKVLVLGIDGMDPRLSKYHMEQGHMPNLKKLLEVGAAREDLVMLGAHPTITPPMWTTLATGAYPMTHGITDFWRQDPDDLNLRNYALDSRLCKAEQMWNVTAEAGKKTFVLHWPGSSWPPSSDSENLYVIDGTNPEGICMSTGEIEHSFLAFGDATYENVTFSREADGNFQLCTVEDLDLNEQANNDEEEYDASDSVASAIRQEIEDVRIVPMPGIASSQTYVRFANSLSPIKDAEKWEFEIPA
ncbi:MAG: alkaline phosphatase family protein, partial [Peptococcaceae bacterium]|nr:alkaline phosphatase family protein [Peptococcaceae bacterium]